VGLDLQGLPGWLRPRRRMARQVAVALGYQPGSGRAPEIVAKGYGHLAEHILEVARERGVPVREDADLAGTLSRLETGTQIPEELYQAIADVLAFVYRMNAGFARVGRG